MRNRAGRHLVLVILLAGGAGAAWSSWNATRLVLQLDRDQRRLTDQIDQLLTALDTVATAQQSYVTPSPDQDLSRVPDLLGQIRSGVEALRSAVRSVEAGRELQGVAAAAATLQDVEARAQEHIRLGQSLMATDLIFSEGRSADEAISSGLRTIRAAESDAFATDRADALDLSWTIGGVAAALWAVGLILLVRVPPVVAREDVAPVLVPAPSPLSISDRISDDIERPSSAVPDLHNAASVCTAIAQMTNAEALPVLLQRAAAVLEASGIVVWMAAGEELFAAAAYGYPPQVIRKLGPIHRSAINATAAAWRSSTLQAVAGDHGARGALAAPMLGPDRCIGVLAVEVGVGQDDNASTRAITMMFAAQLAAALAAWPAASTAAPVEAPPFEKVVEG